MSGKVGINTASRLHFGMFSLPSADSGWHNQEGDATLPRRNFGGVGLMTNKPLIFLTVEQSDEWCAQGPLSERALHFAKIYCDAVELKMTFRLVVTVAPSEHLGLGTGTQLGLAVARGIAELTRPASSPLPEHEAAILAQRVGRGLRSALGVHGFNVGGFLVEGGKATSDAISPLLFRKDFPDWPILLISPREIVGLHGRPEMVAFSELHKQMPNDRTTESLCRLVLLGLLPALAERDRTIFGEALYDFNRRSGEMFRTIQGGVYAHPRIQGIISSIRAFGIKGVGQSSWGPTIFAVGDPDELASLGNRLTSKHGIAKEEMIVTFARNRGAEILG